MKSPPSSSAAGTSAAVGLASRHHKVQRQQEAKDRTASALPVPGSVGAA